MQPVHSRRQDKKDSSGSKVLTSGDNVVATTPAYAYLPLVAAVAMDSERLSSVSAINVRFRRVPPDFASYKPLLNGVLEVGYQITGWGRLSPTSVIFQTATAGHTILISGGSVKVQLVRDGNVTWSGSVCASNAQCAPLPAWWPSAVYPSTRPSARPSTHHGRRAQVLGAACRLFRGGR